MIRLEQAEKQYKNFHLDCSVEVQEGMVTGLIGPNGAGKSTTFRLLTGLAKPEAGRVEIFGKEISELTAEDRRKIGVVWSDAGFSGYLMGKDLIAVLKNMYPAFDEGWFQKKCEEFHLPMDKKLKDFSTGMKAKLKVLSAVANGDARLLILDEPTAVLTPQEADRLFDILRNMRKDGCSIMIITHKLQEVLALSDRVAILRKGKYIDTVETAQANVQSLSEMMVGSRVDLNIRRLEPKNVKKRLIVKNLNCRNKENVKTLDEVDLTVNTGEILGIAGISGSGQKEFLEAIAGLQEVESGSICLLDDQGNSRELCGMDSISINKAGISLAFVPEDRIGMGLVGDMDMTDNMMLRSYRNGKGPFLDRKGPKALALKIKEQLEVMTPSISAPVRQMSGGNVQKVLVGREDINTSHVIYRLLNEQKEKGVAVVCVIEDLDVVLELCDRIAVFCGGKITGIADGRTATKEEIGLLMTKHEKGGDVS